MPVVQTKKAPLQTVRTKQHNSELVDHQREDRWAFKSDHYQKPNSF